ncbi:hypothetical protein HYV64_04185 [Candidatus Shapirobacteria bacterium]|nr:hypothetical protein [Candidatus Shapirobacteria bacterium]
MVGEVYERYRGGGSEKGREEVETFDRAIGYLMKRNFFEFNKEGMQPIFNNKDGEGMAVMGRLREMASRWCERKGEIDGEDFIREIYMGVERWSLNFVLLEKNNHHLTVKDFMYRTDELMANPGMELQVGMVLTEDTRVWVKNEAGLNYRNMATYHHIDKRKMKNDEAMIRLNGAKDLLSKKNLFEKAAGGW